MDVPVGHAHGDVAGERLPPGDHFEDHHADRVDVAAGVRDPVRDEFGRHVGRRPYEDPDVDVSALAARASPKSATLTRPSSVRSTFSGLTSRCTIPAA